MARKADRKRYYQPIWERLKSEWELARNEGRSNKGAYILVEVPSSQTRRFYKAISKEKDLDVNWPPKQFLKLRTSVVKDDGAVAVIRFSLRTYRTGNLMSAALAKLDAQKAQTEQENSNEK